MDNIKNIITDVIGKIALKETEKHAKIERIWKNILEDHQQKHTFLEGINNGVVLISVDSPIQLYQMRTQRRKILKRLQQELEDVKDLKFKIGKNLGHH